MHVGQAVIPARMAIGLPLVVQPQLVQDRRLEVMEDAYLAPKQPVQVVA